MNIKTLIALMMLGSVSLTGCDIVAAYLATAPTAAACSADESKAKVQSLFLDRVRIEAKQILNPYIVNGENVDLTLLDHFLKQIKVTAQDVRTIENSKNSNEKQCAAILSITLPSDMVDLAEQTRRLLEVTGVEQAAVMQDFKYLDRVLSYDVGYVVQPTDDGEKMYIKLSNGQAAATFVGEVMADAIRHSNLVQEQRRAAELQKAEQRRIEAEEQKAQAEQAAIQRTEREYVSLLIREAKQGIDNANDNINIVWQATTPEVRKILLDEQRIWLKKRDLECRIAAQQEASEAKEVTRLNCETQMTIERTEELRQKIAAIEAEMY
ncbi:MAG: lysozyme inhibitor LprI family protein [Acinetobacter sp.]|nr:lysozyme inhibitor LprI family protein [Acinetobacter sp.]